MDVTDILRDRIREPQGLQRMAMVSAGLHLMLAVVLVAAPRGWFSAREPDARSVMTITLGGGAQGPANTGMTPLAARPVQVQTPAEAPEPRRPEPIRPPAARTPEMTIPRESSRPQRNPPPQVTQAPPEARGTTPTRGAEQSSGQSIAETGARPGRAFGGLASGGGGGGDGVRLDVANFCCPEWISSAVERIRANWNSRAEVPAEAEVKFTVHRDGTITNIVVERSSGFQALDINAQRALILTKQVPPLPAQFTNPTLVMYLTFRYQR